MGDTSPAGPTRAGTSLGLGGTAATCVGSPPAVWNSEWVWLLGQMPTQEWDAPQVDALIARYRQCARELSSPTSSSSSSPASGHRLHEARQTVWWSALQLGRSATMRACGLLHPMSEAAATHLTSRLESDLQAWYAPSVMLMGFYRELEDWPAVLRWFSRNVALCIKVLRRGGR